MRGRGRRTVGAEQAHEAEGHARDGVAAGQGRGEDGPEREAQVEEQAYLRRPGRPPSDSESAAALQAWTSPRARRSKYQRTQRGG
jgi:hypothetical protein